MNSVLRKRSWLQRCLRHDQSGQILPFYAAALFGLVALAGLVIDGSMIFLESQELRAMAESAALAGAMNVDEMALALSDNCFKLDAARAGAAARQYCQANSTDGAQCSVSVRVDNSCGGAGYAFDSVTVTVSRPMDTYFIQAVRGFTPIQLEATATAKMVDAF
jgi:uncharacterized membrane protein